LVLVFFGKILRTRGIKGEVVVSLSPGIVIQGEEITVELKSSKYTLSKKITSISLAGSEAIISFSDVNSINAALKIVGYSLYADLPVVKKKRLATVLGFSVFDGQGNCWGKVKAQPHYSFNQLLEVEDAQTGEICFVPWHDSIVKKIERRAKIIVIDPPQGLRDLNR
jgi:16S rRNA processing protein RimM